MITNQQNLSTIVEIWSYLVTYIKTPVYVLLYLYFSNTFTHLLVSVGKIDIYFAWPAWLLCVNDVVAFFIKEC